MKIVFIVAVVLMWVAAIVIYDAKAHLNLIWWPWTNKSHQMKLLQEDKPEIAMEKYMSQDGFFDIVSFLSDIKAPDMFRVREKDKKMRICTPETGVFLDLYFSMTEDQKMLSHIKRVRVRNVFEYLFMPSKELYSASSEEDGMEPCYEYVMHDPREQIECDFMLTGYALDMFYYEMLACVGK